MKLLSSLLVLVISGIVSPVVAAGQQSEGMGWGQKARPDPVTHKICLPIWQRRVRLHLIYPCRPMHKGC